jgi:hypothetical protein
MDGGMALGCRESGGRGGVGAKEGLRELGGFVCGGLWCLAWSVWGRRVVKEGG